MAVGVVISLGWILERPEGLRAGYMREKGVHASCWRDHGVWWWAAGGVIDMNQLVEHVFNECMCLCLRQLGDQGVQAQLLNKLSMQGMLPEESIVCGGKRVHVCACRLEYQQLEWGCGLGGSYVQVPGTEGAGIQGCYWAA